MDVSEAKRLKTLDDENGRLKRLLTGGHLCLRNIRLTIKRKMARTLSRLDQSTVRFLRRFSVSSWAILFRVSSANLRTPDSFVARASFIVAQPQFFAPPDGFTEFLGHI